MPTIDEFRAELSAQLNQAEKRGAANVDINAGELHRKIGGYPGRGNRMPVCCDALYGAQGAGDEVIAGPPKGKGASLTIRYQLPRRRHA